MRKCGSDASNHSDQPDTINTATARATATNAIQGGTGCCTQCSFGKRFKTTAKNAAAIAPTPDVACRVNAKASARGAQLMINVVKNTHAQIAHAYRHSQTRFTKAHFSKTNIELTIT